VVTHRYNLLGELFGLVAEVGEGLALGDCTALGVKSDTLGVGGALAEVSSSTKSLGDEGPTRADALGDKVRIMSLEFLRDSKDLGDATAGIGLACLVGLQNKYIIQRVVPVRNV
jgi:hypothetical protein